MKVETGFGNHSEKNKYILVVHQGDSVCTLMFTGLEEEVHLYNYGTIGHFWVKRYEYLRQLEYMFAIIRDKREYLGERYCNRREQKLAALADSTVELYLLSGNQQRISRGERKCLETSRTGFVRYGRTAEGNR